MMMRNECEVVAGEDDDSPSSRPLLASDEEPCAMENEVLSQERSPGTQPDSPSWMVGLRHRAKLCRDRLLSQKFAVTSQFVVSAKMWTRTIPTRNCDVLTTFPAQTDDDTLMWVLARLRARVPELNVHVRHHSNTGVYGFYLTASYEHLLRGAEEIAIRKPIKSEYGGGNKEFVHEDQEYFVGVDDSSTFLTSEERQSIVRHFLFNLRAHQGDQLDRIRFLEGQAIVPVLMSRCIIDQVLPLHCPEDLAHLREHWVQAFFHSQPLDRVCDYFGVKIALYFAYLGHYTKALLCPAFLGLLFWLLEGTHQYTDDVCFVLFAFFNVAWATLYLENWKRKGAEYAYKWGTLDKEDELLVEPRALFHGRIVRSTVTGRFEPSYPSWKRNLFRYFVSLPVVMMCLSVVFIILWWILELQNWVNIKVHSGATPFFCKFLPKILLAICISLLDDVYKKIPIWLNNKENHRLDITYENNLIIKLVLFQFVNSFLSLFYIAFYLQDMQQLKDQLAALLITRQVIGNIREAVLPYVMEKIKLFKIGYRVVEAMSPETLERQIRELEENDKRSRSSSREEEEEEKEGRDDAWHGGQSRSSPDSDEILTRKVCNEEIEEVKTGLTLGQAEVEACMKKYEDTYEDYLEMLIQFGYVTLFSSAFPMAAMCALLNNIIEIRSDAFKLCMTFQRPFGQRVENIGIWQHGLELMSIIAVMVNSALIGISDLADRLFPGWGTVERIVFIVFLEHFVLAVKFLVAYAIPDIPHKVAEEKARLEFLRREALKQVTTSRPSNLSGLNLMNSPGDVPVAGDQTTPDPKKTEVMGKIEENRPAEQLETLSLISTSEKRASDVVHQRGLLLPISPH